MCRLVVVNDDKEILYEWQADRQLAKGLLRFIIDSLEKEHQTIDDISGIGVLRGPGSFTGLRIGLTVANTMASSMNIAIVGEVSEQWQTKAIARLKAGNNDKMVLPLYDRPANITKPRK